MNDNFCIGVDIEDISRFKNLNKKDHKSFLNNVYTENELDYCYSKSKPEQHLAARFAAKEAVIKALSGMNFLKIEDLPRHFEITRDENNSARINFLSENKLNFKFRVSMSHSNNMAMAFVVGIKNEK